MTFPDCGSSGNSSSWLFKGFFPKSEVVSWSGHRRKVPRASAVFSLLSSGLRLFSLEYSWGLSVLGLCGFLVHLPLGLPSLQRSLESLLAGELETGKPFLFLSAPRITDPHRPLASSRKPCYALSALSTRNLNMGSGHHKTKFSAQRRFICPRRTEDGNKGQRLEIEEER